MNSFYALLAWSGAGIVAAVVGRVASRRYGRWVWDAWADAVTVVIGATAGGIAVGLRQWVVAAVLLAPAVCALVGLARKAAR